MLRGSNARSMATLKAVVAGYTKFFSSLITIATDTSARADNRMMKVSRDYPTLGSLMKGHQLRFLLPILSQLDPWDRADAADRRSEYRPFAPADAVMIEAIMDDVEVLRSKQKPKKMVLLGSNGLSYTWLAKNECKGDLRKDMRMMEVAGFMNEWLANDAEAQRRWLKIRLFSVIPLNEIAGFIEWVPNLRTFRSIVTDLSTADLGPPKYSAAFKAIMEGFQNSHRNPQALHRAFTELGLRRFPPVLHRFFVETFGPDPSRWLQARREFVRSLAVWSAVGFVIGLGDRHGENILLDTSTGECVHVDFDCLFGKGLLLAVPEVVPFRLTPNLLSCMGVTGVHGSFEAAMTHTLRILRERREYLVSLLQAFVHDPLIEWTRHGKNTLAPGAVDDFQRGDSKARSSLQEIEWKLEGKLNFAPQGPAGAGGGRADGPEKINAWQHYPVSATRQAQELTRAAACPRNLALMYAGWMPWM
eukprot:Polyplicarium_translucidae@DN125_c0_g1_i1.p1